jgi:thiosulfate dehydrogenase [quinone] large subunit
MKSSHIWTLLRFCLGFIFLWAFIDKLFGLGFATPHASAWMLGGSPTSGFLLHAVKGPFASFYHGLAGVAFIDWMFMFGLLFVGLALIFNKYIKLGALVGSIMLFLMYLALVMPENNPLIDEHIIYILVLGLLGNRVEGWGK